MDDKAKINQLIGRVGGLAKDNKRLRRLIAENAAHKALLQEVKTLREHNDQLQEENQYLVKAIKEKVNKNIKLSLQLIRYEEATSK